MFYLGCKDGPNSVMHAPWSIGAPCSREVLSSNLSQPIGHVSSNTLLHNQPAEIQRWTEWSENPAYQIVEDMQDCFQLLKRWRLPPGYCIV